MRRLPLWLAVVLASAACSGQDETLTVLHTNDWQSHLLGQGPNAEYSPDSTGDDSTIGGIARVKTLVDGIRDEADHPVVLYDGGDWMAGALFQVLQDSDPAELQMMEAMGYDAITLGNHEFDWGSAGLGDMISLADSLGVGVPIVSSNLEPDPEDATDDALEALYDSGRIDRTLVMEAGDIRIGLFGILGDGAQSITPGLESVQGLTAVDAAQDAVDELEGEEDLDLIIMLSHSGIAEDIAIAESVDGIDLIVGGHSHVALFDAIDVNGTKIVQAGAYTLYLGEVTIEKVDDVWEVADAVLHAVDDDTAGDAEANTMVDGFLTALDDGYLTDEGITFDEPIAWAPDAIRVNHTVCEESAIGDLATDAYRFAATDVLTDPIDVAFEGQGVLRDPFFPGDSGVQGFSDVFRILPLGGGLDGRPGYALTHFYLTARELRTACEVTATVTESVGCSFLVEMSGMRCTVDMDLLPTFRVTTVELWDGEEWDQISLGAGNTELYHATANTYLANLLGLLEELSDGALRLEPKDEFGDPHTSVDDMLIDADPLTGDVEELKVWEALMLYLDSFEDTDSDGIPDIPESYTEQADRYIGFEGPVEEYVEVP